LAVRSIAPDDGRLAAMNQAIEDRLEEFVAALDGLDRSSQ
jgi:hypothetical protein